MPATIHDVARLSGFSSKTVSKVFNGESGIGTETRQKVLAAIAALDYRPNLSARSLRSGRTGVIGLAVPSIEAPYFAELISLIVGAARQRGLRTIVEELGEDGNRQLAANDTEVGWADGWLLTPLGDDWASRLHGLRRPVVVLEDVDPTMADVVAYDDRAIAAAATRHLIAVGRRRIAAIGVSEDPYTPRSLRLRLAGYRDSLLDADLPFDPRLLSGAAPSWTRDAGTALFRNLLESGIKFDAVFALNDALAIGALRAAADVGLRVPDDLAVIGIDDIDECRFSVPKLSSVEPGKKDLAERAVSVLAARIEGSAPPQFDTKHPLFEVRIRDS